MFFLENERGGFIFYYKNGFKILLLAYLKVKYHSISFSPFITYDKCYDIKH